VISRWIKRRADLVVPFLAILFLLPLLASCGTSAGPGSGGSTVSCTAPTLAGNTVRVELADSGGGMMGGGGTSGSGGMNGHGGMMLRAGRVSVDGPVSVDGTQPVSFVAHNGGSLVHELVVLQLSAGTSAGSMAMGADQKVSESASRAEASKPCGAGAGSGLEPGATGWVTVTLAPGGYALVCNLPGHYAAGMWAEFTVK